MNATARLLDESYAYCHAMARRSGSNFYASFRLLSAEKRRAMESLYAFMRYTDDLGDDPSTLEQPVARDVCPTPQLADPRPRRLAAWREAFEQALAGESLADSADPIAMKVLPAVVDTVQRFHIPPEHLREVVEGVEMDLEPQLYETFDELSEYCRRVASAVGLACIHVWGFDGPAAIEPAVACGLAVQLTNILRDLKEDALAGRVYLPLEDCRKCGYSIEQLRRGEVNPALARLIALETARAKTLYHQGCDLIEHLDPSGQRIFGMMMSVYYRLLVKIEQAGAGCFDTRVRLNCGEKARIAARWILLPPRRAALP